VLTQPYTEPPESRAASLVNPTPGDSLIEIDTPALLVDLDRMETNIAGMSALARESGLSLRPHAKAHKVPELARLEVEAGAVGITCQKLGEAEVMAAAGLTDLLIAFPMVGARKIQRLIALARRVHVITTIDSLEAAAPLSQAAASEGVMIDAVLEVDVGYHRCGVDPQAALGTAQALATEFEGLRFRGLMAYEGHIYNLISVEAVEERAALSYNILGDIAARLRAAGVPVDIVSVGASAAARVAARHPAVTELRAGSYIFNDLAQIAMGGATESECALTVLATVVSTQTSERAVIDAGAKALSFVTIPGYAGYGSIRGHEGAVIDRLADEHGMISIPMAVKPFYIGERVRIIPNSGSSVINEFSDLVGVRNGTVECVWPIAARGRMQ
jgi:D-serine deaminase-like pyridoxal phosphate-dependent protein